MGSKKVLILMLFLLVPFVSALEPVVWVDQENVDVTANSISENCGNWCGSAAVSQQVITDEGYVEFTVSDPAPGPSAGLSNGNTDWRKGDIDYAMHIAPAWVTVWENDVWAANVPYVAGSTYKVEVSGDAVTYYVDDQVVHTSSVSPTLPLLVDTSLQAPGATLNNVIIEIGSQPTVGPGDVNGDLMVDLNDLIMMTVNLGNSGFDPAADINGDGRVNIFDMVVVARNYGNDYSGGGCGCGNWVSGSCGAGSCSLTQRQQTRSCTPSACQAETQCVNDASCTMPSSDGWGVLGDSNSDEYRADDNRGGAYATTTLNWMELLVNERGLDFGTWGIWAEPRRTGYANNWARTGADSAGMVSVGQHTGLAQQITNGEVRNVVIYIGVNDWNIGGGNYGQIYDGTISGSALQSKINDFVSDVTASVDALLAANPATRIVLLDVLDPGLNSNAWSSYPDPVRRQVVTDAINTVNANLNLVATTRGVAVLEMGSFFQDLESQVDQNGFVNIGGELIDTVNMGDEPHHMALGDTHPGTIASGLLANEIIDEFNSFYNLGISPLTHQEFLNAAGITPSVCPDGSCNGGETCSTCPADCGSCGGNTVIDLAGIRISGSGSGLVNTGIPLQPGQLFDTNMNNVALWLDTGSGLQEVSIYTEALTGRHFADNSVRSVLVQWNGNIDSVIGAELRIGTVAGQPRLSKTNPSGIGTPEAVLFPTSVNHLIATEMFTFDITPAANTHSDFSGYDALFDQMGYAALTNNGDSGADRPKYGRAMWSFYWLFRNGGNVADAEVFFKGGSDAAVRLYVTDPLGNVAEFNDVDNAGQMIHYWLTGDDLSRTHVGQLAARFGGGGSFWNWEGGGRRIFHTVEAITYAIMGDIEDVQHSGSTFGPFTKTQHLDNLNTKLGVWHNGFSTGPPSLSTPIDGIHNTDGGVSATYTKDGHQSYMNAMMHTSIQRAFRVLQGQNSGIDSQRSNWDQSLRSFAQWGLDNSGYDTAADTWYYAVKPTTPPTWVDPTGWTPFTPDDGSFPTDTFYFWWSGFVNNAYWYAWENEPSGASKDAFKSAARIGLIENIARWNAPGNGFQWGAYDTGGGGGLYASSTWADQVAVNAGLGMGLAPQSQWLDEIA